MLIKIGELEWRVNRPTYHWEIISISGSSSKYIGLLLEGTWA